MLKSVGIGVGVTAIVVVLYVVWMRRSVRGAVQTFAAFPAQGYAAVIDHTKSIAAQTASGNAPQYQETR